MNEENLNMANQALTQKGDKKIKRTILIILAIIIALIFIILMFILKNRYNNSTYPYIPAPKHTLNTGSLSELFTSILMNADDTAIEYSVISREKLMVRK